MAIAFSSSESEAIERQIDSSYSERRDASFTIEEMYEIDHCIKWISSNHYSRVALQFPDSMLNDANAVAKKLESVPDTHIFITGDTSYGSCCVDELNAARADPDAIIHFGHACLSPTNRFPVLYVFGKQVLDVQHAASSFKSQFENTKSPVILIFEVMYSYAIGDIVHHLIEYDNLIISELEIPCTTPKLANPADSISIKNCRRFISLPKNSKLQDYSIFYIGSQEITLTNTLLSFKECDFYSYKPLDRICRKETVDINRHLRKRYYYIEKAKDSQIIGLLVGTLGISNYLEVIKHLKQLVEKAGKKCYTLAVGKLNAAKLANFPEIELFVNVACVESTMIESKEFYQSIVTPYELELALNSARQWTGDYVMDFSDILPGAANHVPLGSVVQTDGDVSLLTGKLRITNPCEVDDATDCSDSSIAIRNDMALSTIHDRGAGEFLSQRSWKGLEQRLGETDIAKIETGQSGIACVYEDEKLNAS